MGYVQQMRAERGLAALRQLSAPQAKVIRDSERQIVPAAEFVSGDIILVEEGDIIPADGRVLESTALQAAEAALTVETAPVSKKVAAVPEDASVADQGNMIFGGTVVTYGRGRAVVTATGPCFPIIGCGPRSPRHWCCTAPFSISRSCKRCSRRRA
jgi:P-type Ca2+ transporter type 2C